MWFFLACAQPDVQPQAASLRVDDVVEVTSTGSSWTGAVALDADGAELDLPIVATASSDERILTPGPDDAFTCVDSGIAVLVLAAPGAQAEVQVHCSLVERAVISPAEVDVVLGPDEDERTLDALSVALLSPDGGEVDTVARRWESTDERVVELDDQNRLRIVGEGSAELVLRAGHVVERVPVNVGRRLHDQVLIVPEADLAAIPLEPARYRASVTSDRPIALKFEGADCASEGAGESLTVDCLLLRPGKVEIVNPSVLGVGDGPAEARAR